MTAGGGSSPYDDEPTGAIPEAERAQGPAGSVPSSMRRRSRPATPDRDTFYARHARTDDAADDSRLTRVEEIDDDLDDLGSPGQFRGEYDDEGPTRRLRVPRGRVTSDSFDDRSAGRVDETDSVTVPVDRLDADDAWQQESATDRGDSATTVLRRKRVRDEDDLDDEVAGPSRVHDELAEAEERARRGTLGIGLLVLRVAVGGIMLAHGCQKLFGWWNGPRLSGFEDMLANPQNPDIGFASGAVKPLAIIGALSETLGGLMLIVGLFTPVAAAAVLGVMLVAGAYKATLAGGLWFFASGGDGAGIEYELLLAACAVAILLTGPGRLSLDASRGWARRPAWGSAGMLIVGVGSAVAVWLIFNGTNPFRP